MFKRLAIKCKLATLAAAFKEVSSQVQQLQQTMRLLKV